MTTRSTVDSYRAAEWYMGNRFVPWLFRKLSLGLWCGGLTAGERRSCLLYSGVTFTADKGDVQ